MRKDGREGENGVGESHQDGGLQRCDSLHQSDDAIGIRRRCLGAALAVQAHHPLHRHAAPRSGLLVPAPVHHHHPPLTPSFLGCILGESKDSLTLLGRIVSIFAEVSGRPYGTAIDLRRHCSGV